MSPGSIRFLLDEHVDAAILTALRNRGIDCLSAQEAGHAGQPDRALLHFSFQNGRVMVTRDSDYLALHRAGISHSGIVFVPAKAGVGDVTRFLLLVHSVLAAEEMIGAVEICPSGRL